MFHRIESVTPHSDFTLSVQFSEGVTKIYDVKPLFDKITVFREFEDNPEFFYDTAVDTGGYGIVWNDDIDLSCNELWTNGVPVKTPFDGFLAFSDSTRI